jgi:hypothetical protein
MVARTKSREVCNARKGPVLAHRGCILFAFVSLTIMTICPVAGNDLVAPSAAVSGCDTVSPVPPLPKNAKVVSHTSEPDDTALIQTALDHLSRGDWLVFRPGTYKINKHLTISVPGVTLYGKGVTIEATNPTDGALVISADDVSVFDFTFTQDSITRQSTPWSGGIAVYQMNRSSSPRVRGSLIQGNEIKSSAAVGIFIFRADGFTVAGNTVWRSLADGIHVTAGATSGRVIQNSVTQTGDDMIAVVSYTGQRGPQPAAERYQNWSQIMTQLDDNIYIARNQVSDTYWGRGISVVGGSNITIENNKISRIPGAAGVYLQRETSFMTLGDYDILLRGNTLSDIETLPPTYKPPNITIIPSHQGAIEVGSLEAEDEQTNPTYRSAFSISDVAITDNVLESWGFAPIRLGQGPGMVSQILIARNTLSNQRNGNPIEVHSGLVPGSLMCEGNTLNGADLDSRCAKDIASSTISITVVGATLKCSSDGKVQIPAAPRAPSALRSQ